MIAFVIEGTQIEKILNHIGVDSEPPHIAPLRGPPLWEDGGDAQMDEGVHILNLPVLRPASSCCFAPGWRCFG